MCFETDKVNLLSPILFFLVALSQSVGAQPDLTPYQEKCESIGFKPKSEKFADCVVELVELHPKLTHLAG